MCMCVDLALSLSCVWVSPRSSARAGVRSWLSWACGWVPPRSSRAAPPRAAAVGFCSTDKSTDEAFSDARSAGHALVAPETPVALLVDARTASSAELFAAALRDNGRATLLGSRGVRGEGDGRTFGKVARRSLFSRALEGFSRYQHMVISPEKSAVVVLY